MGSQRSTRKADKSSTPVTGIALALAAFLFAIFLFFDSQYFGAYTDTAAVISLAIGIAGMGTSLNELVGQDWEKVLREAKSGVFQNLGFGTGLTLLCVYASVRLSSTLANAIVFPLLMVSLFGAMQGMTNALFLTAPLSQDSAKAGSSGGRVNPFSLIVKLVYAVTAAIGLIASVLTILEFLKVVHS